MSCKTESCRKYYNNVSPGLSIKTSDDNISKTRTRSILVHELKDQIVTTNPVLFNLKLKFEEEHALYIYQIYYYSMTLAGCKILPSGNKE